MLLTLEEAAQQTGKSVRQLRYLIQTKRLEARKLKGTWRIDRNDLPGSEGARKAEAAKQERAIRPLTKVLDKVGPEPGKAGGSAGAAPPKADAATVAAAAAIVAGRGRRRFSIRNLHAVEDGIVVHRLLVAQLGQEHNASSHFREALMLVAAGCNAFQPATKLDYFNRAREQASRTLMSLLLGAEDQSAIIDLVEDRFLGALGGLIRRVERKGAQ